VMVDRKKSQPSAVGVVHQSAASRALTPQLVRRLMQIEDTPCVASDDPNWQPIESVPFRLLFENGQLIREEQRRAQIKEWAELGRIFIDVNADHDLEDLSRLMMFVEVVLWCVRPVDASDAKKTLHELENKVPGWRDKIRLVWLLDNATDVAPYLPELRQLVQHDFKITFSQPTGNRVTILQRGIERIIHHLRGVQIGIALGGGAARGMAHLGVLKVLEQNGIYVDMVAGTSAGAMTGTLYASGMTVEHTIESFMNDLRLPWIFRRLPAGGYWYLLYKYRRGQFEPMLRKYLGDKRLEQLPIPMLTVTVDLVSGGPVVRETGDATRGILESINLPGLSSPIIGDGEALVDGGLVNNIPADVLVDKGCNFVLASSVTAKLEREFVGIRNDQPTQKHGSPSFLKVLLRGHLVQSFNMNAVGVQPADFVIEPDLTAFDLSEFGRTDEMAAIGEQTTLESLAQIRQLLSKLDPDLFPAA
jgi:NTE family protein